MKLLIKYAELALKKKNRAYFENMLCENIKEKLNGLNHKIIREYGRIYIEYDDKRVIDRLKETFGIYEIAEVKETELDEKKIIKAAIELIKKIKNKSTFKVFTKRANKKFKYESMHLSAMVGHHILKNTDLKVDVKEPEIKLYIEIRDKAYIYIDSYKGLKGLPIGVSSKSLVLLSGGIDSVVASFLMAKRGVKVSFVHFHSFPFTSLEAFNKIKELKKQVEKYTTDTILYSFNILKAQNEIKKKTNSEYFTVLQRRLMTRLATRLAKKLKINSLTTGENLAQVASQTMEAINCTNNATDLVIYRPLITYDKEEIIIIAKKIDTFNISILPFEDCCTVFLPKKVNTRPKLKNILKEEKKLDLIRIEDEIFNEVEKYN